MRTGSRARLRCVIAGVVFVLLLPLLTSSAQTRFEYAIGTDSTDERQPLGQVLMDLASETGADLLYDPRLVADLFVPEDPVDGDVDERLARLLSGTALTFARLESGTYVLVPRVRQTSAQGAIRGKVVDATTGRTVTSAHVLLAGSGKATATDGNGMFQFENVPPGAHRLLTSHVGYGVRIDTTWVPAGGHAGLEVGLSPVELAISPIIVEDVRGLEAVHRFDRYWMTRRLEGVPAGISPDVVRSLNHLMGVRVGDAMADVHVQGGESGEHQFRLDGVPVFEPVHLRGFLGAFNPFAIGRVTVHKAGFGATYGSHLAGVIAAEHALTSTEGHRIDLQIDPLSLNARVDGAFDLGPQVRARVMTAARTSLWSLYPEQLYPPLKNLLREWNTPDTFLPQAWFFAFEQQVDPEIAAWFEAAMDTMDLDYTSASDPELGFGDLHLAGDVRFGRRHLIYASLYRGWNRLNGNRLSLPFAGVPSEGGGSGPDLDDAVDGPERGEASAHRDDYSWVNATMQIRHDAMLSDQSLLRSRLRSSEYSLTHAYNALAGGSVQVLPLPDGWAAVRLLEDIRPTDNGNGIREIALESSFDHEASSRFAVTTGAEVINTRYRFAIEDVSNYRPLSDSSSNWRLAWYGQAATHLSNRVRLTTGARITYLPHREAAYIEPRGELQYEVPHSRIGPWSVWAATGLYRQFVNQFSVSSVSPSVLLPAIRFWLPIDASVAPPKALHFAGGVQFGPLRSWTIRAESYYKHQPHLLFIDYISLWDQRREGDPSLESGQDRFLDAGRGYGYGGAMNLQYESGGSRALLRYEFSHARRSRTLLASSSGDAAIVPGEAVRASGYEPVPWNEPHRVEAALDWSLSDHLTVAARWRSYWGRAWAFRQSYYDYLATDPLLLPSYGSSGYDLRKPEDHELPPFHQLDLAAAYSLSVGPTVCQVRVDLLNALNRANEADWTLQPSETEDGDHEYQVAARTMLPRTPSVTLRLRW